MSVPALRWEKDPDEVLDFKIDWGANVLEDGDEIDSSTWIFPPGVTKDSDSHDTTTVTVWVSGGTIRRTVYPIVNRITTTGGRTYDQTANLTIKNH